MQRSLDFSALAHRGIGRTPHPSRLAACHLPFKGKALGAQAPGKGFGAAMLVEVLKGVLCRKKRLVAALDRIPRLQQEMQDLLAEADGLMIV